MKGFTLLELMVVLLISSVVAAVLVMSFSAGRSSWYEADSQIALQQELRKAESQICDDLRQSSTTQISVLSNGNPYTTASFNISQGVLSSGAINWSSSSINYSLSGNQILRSQGGSSRVIANNITSLTFTRYANSTKVIRIDMVTQKNTAAGRLLSANISSAVDLRN